MGSNYFGSERERSHSSSSSRKGKKSNSEKPKQPQRGLGVAQLEKIRLHTHLASHQNNIPYSYNNINSSSSSSLISYSPSSPLSYGFPGHHNMMGLPTDLDRTNIVTYGDYSNSQSSRWHHHHHHHHHHQGNAAFATQHFVDSTITRPFFEPGISGSLSNNKKKDTEDFMGSSNQNSEDIDLELRLSL